MYAEIIPFKRPEKRRTNLKTLHVVRVILTDCEYIDDDTQLLLAKRRDDKKNNPGLWELLGGKQEDKETLGQAAIREAKEEANLVLDPLSLGDPEEVENRQITDSDVYKRIKTSALEAYFCGMPEIPEVNPEHSEIGWIRVGNLGSYPVAMTTLLALDHFGYIELSPGMNATTSVS